MEDKKPELEEIHLRDRAKIYNLLYPDIHHSYFKKDLIGSADYLELLEVFKNAHIPTHKIKVNA